MPLAISIPTLSSKFIDYRDTIPGDSYNWSWVHALSEYKYIAIHHSAGPINQTPVEIANYHVNQLGWGGVGYHFIIDVSGKVYYVGDLTTARAHVKDYNDVAIGICLIGTYMNTVIPNDQMIQSASLLCSHLINETPELSNITSWDNVVGHKELGGGTACPGDSWNLWKQKLIAVQKPPIIVTPPPVVIDDTGTKAKLVMELYLKIFGRTPDQSGLSSWVASKYTIEQIRVFMIDSAEHKTLISNANKYKLVQITVSESIQKLEDVQTLLKKV